MRNDKEPDKSSKQMTVIIAVFFIAAGAYGLSSGDLGWAGIIIGTAILAYVAITGRS